MKILDLDVDLTFKITRDFGSTISTDIIVPFEAFSETGAFNKPPVRTENPEVDRFICSTLAVLKTINHCIIGCRLICNKKKILKKINKKKPRKLQQPQQQPNKQFHEATASWLCGQLHVAANDST